MSPNRVTAQDFYDFDKCPHRVYLNRFGDSKEKLPLSDFLNLLFESALLHEKNVIHGMQFQSPLGMTIEEQADSTLKLMAAGAERIFQGVLLLPADSGRPDLLEKIPGQSKFGDFFYKPVDIKAGSGYKDEAKGTLRDDYALQLFHYGTLLNQVQGAFPPVGEILNKKGQRVLYDLKHYAMDYAAEMLVARSLVEGKNTDEPVLCSHCRNCQWFGHCEPILEKSNDVSLLPDIGRSKKMNLKQAGVVSIQDVPKFDFKNNKVVGFGPKTIDGITRNARVVLAGRMEIIQKPVLPDAATKIYFDFEDDPTQDLIYLCGMLFEPVRDQKEFHGFFGTDEAGEAKLWRDFQGLCKALENEDYLVFHYSPYEKSKITQLEKKYGLTEGAAVDRFRNKMVDLNRIVEQSLALPTRSYGLKSVAPFANHKWTAKEAGGAQSIVWFQDYQNDPSKKEILNTLLTYNQEDCRALKAVYEWLKML